MNRRRTKEICSKVGLLICGFNGMLIRMRTLTNDIYPEPGMTTAKKRKAPSPEDNRLKKVAKTGSAKNVGVVRAGLESLSLGGADDDAGEAGRSSKSRRPDYIKFNCPANIRSYFHRGPILRQAQYWLYY